MGGKFQEQNIFRNLMLRSGGNITKENLYWDLVEYGINRVRFDWKNVAEYEYIFGVKLFIR